ncbi:MAG: carboxypeptidase regulatory-like domain-containing protein, partial [Sphingobacteriales bacterium]
MKHTWPCLLLLLLIAFSACRKSEGTKPGKDTSDTTQNPPVFEQIPSIAGSMLPLFAVKDFEVLIKEIRPGKDTVLKPDAQGAFKINGLADGTYSVSIKIAGHTVMELATIVRSFTTQNLGRLDFTGSQYIPLVTGTGKITGSIRPAGVSTMISATHTGNWQTYTTNVNPDGTFTFENLPAGTYSGSLYNGTRYTPVNNAGFELTISDGQVSNVGEIAFYDNTDPASPNYITYEIDGLKNIRKRFVGAAYGVPYFSLFTYDKGFTQSTNSGSIGQYVETDRLDISLDEVNGTGTYHYFMI